MVPSELLCLTDLIALAGQASTQALHVLPRHLSLSKTIDESSVNVIASTGQRVTHEPQFMHSSQSTSMSFGTLTVTPFLRKAFTTLVKSSSGTSAKTSPPLLLMFAVMMFMGSFKSRITLEIMGCSTIFSENLKRILVNRVSLSNQL